MKIVSPAVLAGFDIITSPLKLVTSLSAATGGTTTGVFTYSVADTGIESD